MKKVLFSMLVVLFAVTTVNAKGKSIGKENTTFGKGAKVLNLGVGLFSGYSSTGMSSLIPPLAVAFDACIIDNVFDESSSIGVGGFLGYHGQRYTYGGTSWGYSHLVFGGRGTFHYQFVDKLDTYAGVGLGYHMVRTSYTDAGLGSGGFYAAGFIGARYYFTSGFGAFAEFGNGISYTTLGVSLKF